MIPDAYSTCLSEEITEAGTLSLPSGTGDLPPGLIDGMRATRWGSVDLSSSAFLERKRAAWRMAYLKHSRILQRDTAPLLMSSSLDAQEGPLP